MATTPKRSAVAETRNMTAQPMIYELRAAEALRLCINGANADKRTARAFDCSVRLAQLLRGGKCWTIQRLSQASCVLGQAFDQMLATGEAHNAEIADVNERLARLEAQLDAIDRRLAQGLAPQDVTQTRQTR